VKKEFEPFHGGACPRYRSSCAHHDNLCGVRRACHDARCSFPVHDLRVHLAAAVLEGLLGSTQIRAEFALTSISR
jgi:hypothetical protein